MINGNGNSNPVTPASPTAAGSREVPSGALPSAQAPDSRLPEPAASVVISPGLVGWAQVGPRVVTPNASREGKQEVFGESRLQCEFTRSPPEQVRRAWPHDYGDRGAQAWLWGSALALGGARISAENLGELSRACAFVMPIHQPPTFRTLALLVGDGGECAPHAKTLMRYVATLTDATTRLRMIENIALGFAQRSGSRSEPRLAESALCAIADRIFDDSQFGELYKVHLAMFLVHNCGGDPKQLGHQLARNGSRNLSASEKDELTSAVEGMINPPAPSSDESEDEEAVRDPES